MPQNYYDQRFSNHANVGGSVNNYTITGGSLHLTGGSQNVQNVFQGFSSQEHFNSFPQDQRHQHQQTPGTNGPQNGWPWNGSAFGKLRQSTYRV